MNLMKMIRSQWDRTTAIVALAVGGLALALGWFGVSGTVIPGKQLPYLVSGAVFALFCLGIAGTLWLSADLRDEWRKINEVSWKLSKVCAAIGVDEECIFSRMDASETQPLNSGRASESVPISREAQRI